jgi:NAD(P) transhydrogenase subunit alpha
MSEPDTGPNGRRRRRGAVGARERRMSHYAILVVELTILALAIFLGIEVISKVPTLLHTPLMSGTNAIHGIVIVGAMLVAGMSNPDGLTKWIGFVAMILAAANVVGGFVVTDRMLEMFKKREPPPGGDGAGPAGGGGGS